VGDGDLLHDKRVIRIEDGRNILHAHDSPMAPHDRQRLETDDHSRVAAGDLGSVDGPDLEIIATTNATTGAARSMHPESSESGVAFAARGSCRRTFQVVNCRFQTHEIKRMCPERAELSALFTIQAMRILDKRVSADRRHHNTLKTLANWS
jgi:hypothetical protein